MNVRTRFGALAIASAGILVGGACGTDGEVSVVDDSPMQLSGLQSAAATTAELTDASMTMDMTFDGQSLMSGSLVTQGDSLWMKVNFDWEVEQAASGDDGALETLGVPSSGELIVVDDREFVKGFFASISFMFSDQDFDEDQWIEFDSADAADTGSESDLDAWTSDDDFSEMSQEMLDTLGLLEGAYGDVTEVGTEDIGGVSTTHYQVNVDADDVAEMIDGGSDSSTSYEEFESDGPVEDDTADTADPESDATVEDDADDTPATEDAAEVAVIDVWVDDDGLVRRMESSYTEGGSEFKFIIEITPSSDVSIEIPEDVTAVDPSTLFDDVGELFGEDFEGFGDEFAEEFGESVDEFVDDAEEFLPTEGEVDEWLRNLDLELEDLDESAREFGTELEGLIDEFSDALSTPGAEGE